MYVAKFTSEAIEDIKSLPKGHKNSLRKAIEKKLLTNPEECSEKLMEPLAGFRSFHSGDYRVVFRVVEDLNVVAVVGVGLKTASANVYRKLAELVRTGKLADSVLSIGRLFND